MKMFDGISRLQYEVVDGWHHLQSSPLWAAWGIDLECSMYDIL